MPGGDVEFDDAVARDSKRRHSCEFGAGPVRNIAGRRHGDKPFLALQGAEAL